ncbi:DNA-directed RNA polymerase subunit [Aphelenchoides bicaudatus]|nr:DNA-directed RNA polymerase subunit [Aphelenchoides bicaudatus]
MGCFSNGGQNVLADLFGVPDLQKFLGGDIEIDWDTLIPLIKYPSPFGQYKIRYPCELNCEHYDALWTEPCRWSGVRFTTGNEHEIKKIAHVQVFNNVLYDNSTGKCLPALFSPLDNRLGTTQKTGNCVTCKQNMIDCVGHFGYINLEYPVFHVGFFRLVIQMLQCICKRCASVLLTGEKRTSLRKQIASPRLNYLHRKALHKKLVTLSKGIKVCPNCGFENGVVKKAAGSFLKIVHGEQIVNVDPFLINDDDEVVNLLNRTTNFLDPLRVLNLFSKIKSSDIPLLMVQTQYAKRPTDLLLTCIPVPPVCIRPSVISETRAGTTEDDLTVKLTEIMLINNELKNDKQGGVITEAVLDNWDILQVQTALYIDSELNGIPLEQQPKKFLRSFAQRLKGKQGRFRGNLSGKRVDFSGRTVISPDPNLKVDQVGVPTELAKVFTFPEIVNEHNIEKMRKLVINGEFEHPGANYVVDSATGNKTILRYPNREEIASELKCGDIVERHLSDNDTVLFNRQPSLHRISIMAHRAKVMPYRTFRFNQCACTPYNADFDGDEMNLHLLQTYEARAEASLLMNIKSNLITPRSGEPLVAAIQDFITAGYLLTHKDTFLTRDEVYRCIASIIDVDLPKQQRVKVPPPAILLPQRMWTGKQLIELLIAPQQGTHVKVNLWAPNKSHPKDTDEFTAGDTFVVIRNNQLLAGMLDKALLGSGSKTNIFYILLRDFGEDYALESMWRLGRMSPVFLSNLGFSIGIGDVTPSDGLLVEKAQLLDSGYKKCDEFIEQMNNGKLKARPGMTESETLESLILHELSQIRDHAGKSCVKNLSKYNSPLLMAICGSKGSYINISQMIASVGQQSISGHRPLEDFDFRCLPIFQRHDRSPVARGFVESSFYSGLTPTEMFYHSQAGREGLVDTAVKTAETGYMQRRLVKCLEDLTINYDSTVRTSVGEIVQFQFGEDGLDPCYMEAKSGSVVDYDHIMFHTRNTVPFDFEIGNEQLGALSESVAFMEEAIDSNIRKNHSLFADQTCEYLNGYLERNQKYVDMPTHCNLHPSASADIRQTCNECDAAYQSRRSLMLAHCLTYTQIDAFIKLCTVKLHKAFIEPGTAVGAVSATSIGEPPTQMTLKTFHFSGVASMNITEGVPRIKEIIDAVRQISTPIITAEAIDNKDEMLVRRVKARIEKTTLGEIAEYIEQVFLPDDSFILVKLNPRCIRLLQLEVTMGSIIHSIRTAKMQIPLRRRQVERMGKSMIIVRALDDGDIASMSLALHHLKYALPKVVVRGLPGVHRCVIHADEKRGDTFKLLVEGTDFKEVLATYEINPNKTVFNNASMTAEVLGIEAARTTIISEIVSTMNAHGIDLDRRHVMLLADLMTYRGEVLGITRNGLVKMKDSVLLLASFERTTDHLFEAAFFSQLDNLAGVSESIIMGTQARIGTGMLKLLHNRGKMDISGQKRVPFFNSPDLKLKI